MYTYHFPFIGITIEHSNESNKIDEFLDTIYNLVSEYDYQNSNDFNIEHFNEFKEYFQVKEEQLVKKFILWIKNNQDNLVFKTHYHGSLPTPMQLEFKKEGEVLKINKFNDIKNYTLTQKDIIEISNQVQDFTAFCSRTMDNELYQFLLSNEKLGLSFINLSS